MSVMRNSEKFILPRAEPKTFWSAIHDDYAGEDPRKWKYLAMLALRETANWPLDRIGRAFKHPKGHVSRCLERVKEELADRFRPEPPLAPRGEFPDEDGFGLGAD